MNCPNCKKPMTDTNDPTIKICYTCKKKYRVKVGTVGATNTQQNAAISGASTRQSFVKPQPMRLKFFRCLACGSKEYDESADGKYCCSFCGIKYSEVKELPFERELAIAENLRQTADFEKAKRTYDSIINSYPSYDLTMVYWGLFLCDNSVVIEKSQPTNNETQDLDNHTIKATFPSFYHVQKTSCFDNINYQKAINSARRISFHNADKLNELALKVEDARLMYWDINQKEKDFDIFICYKNDEYQNQPLSNGSTKLANDLYLYFAQKYNVFFAKETLRSLNSDYNKYEPHIYHALYTAKVMLLVCKSRQDLESQWVYNEWSRFMDINAKDGVKKTIIPICLDGFDPYNLPQSLRGLQAYKNDNRLMADISMQLERYISKQQPDAPKSTVNTTSLQNLMWVKIKDLQDFNGAKDLANRILEMDVACANAWLGLAYCDYKVVSDLELVKNDNLLSNNNIKMAIRYAVGEYKPTIDDLQQKFAAIQEQKRLAKLEEERRIAEQKRIEEEKRLAEQKRLEEEIRIAEQKRIEEEKRLAEQRRLEEEERRKAELPQVNGDTVTFGTYPQSLVTDQSLINALGSFDHNSWTSYKYYISGNVQDYMYYIDKTYNGNKYRGVYFNQYRPAWTTEESKKVNTTQKSNGYLTNKIYWFKYEPIKWKIVNNSGGYATIVTDLIIDSQNYHIIENCRQTTRSDYQGNRASSYENNYQYSTIRTWLNTTFINTAFNSNQQTRIQTTVVDNSSSSTGDSYNAYECPNTNDKVRLLSYNEANTYFSNDQSRQKKGTDYALSQGLSKHIGTGCSSWWLRSPYCDESYSARYVFIDGSFCNYIVDHTNYGVVPALKIKL